MGERVFWLPVIAILSVLGTGSMAPASARGSGHGVGISHGVGITRFTSRSRARLPLLFAQRRFVAPGGIAGLGGFQNDFSRRGAPFQNFGWGGDWPYSWWPMNSTVPAEVATEVPSHPEVIVISGANDGRGRAVPEDDYSYVAGCHAIPNGYHCDAPRQQAQSQ